MVPDLLAWKLICPDSSPEAFIFPNREGGVRDPNNYRKRVLGKLREKLNLPKLTFQVIRRTFATFSQTKGTVKDTQGVLRQVRSATTVDVYMQVLPEGCQANDRLDAQRTLQWPARTVTNQEAEIAIRRCAHKREHN